MQNLIQKKICMLGDFAVGKTSLVTRFVEGIFDDKYLSTIGVKITRKELTLDHNIILRLMLWDLAGSERYIGVQASYIQGASGAFLVCDLSRPNTIQMFKAYQSRLHEVNPHVCIVVIGNKADLVAGDTQLEQIKSLLAEYNHPYCITSAKTGQGVDEAFNLLAQNILACSK